MRPPVTRLAPLAYGALATALLLAGCGGSSPSAPVDKGGFTARQRSQAQTALDRIVGTSIPGTIVQLTATVGLPAVCRVHFDSKTSNLDLIMAWDPIPNSGAAFTWFTAAIGSSGVLPSSLHLGITQNRAQLATHYGVGYTRPFEPCSVDSFGYLIADHWTGAYPTTGTQRAIPNQNGA